MGLNNICYFGYDGSNETAMYKCEYDNKSHMCKWAMELKSAGKPKTSCKYFESKIPEWKRCLNEN